MEKDGESFCINCHFLVYDFAAIGCPREPDNTVSNALRKNLKEYPADSTGEGEILKCYKGVWDEGIIGKKERDRHINVINSSTVISSSKK